MSELQLLGRLNYAEAPIARHDLYVSQKGGLPQVTQQPPPGAINTVQVYANVHNNNPGSGYMLMLNPDGSVIGQQPAYTPASAPPGTVQNEQGVPNRISTERLRQWLLGIRLMPSPFPTFGQING